MATLILSAVGTAIGGPIGGTIGTLIGSQIDAEIFKPKGREGPRLKELSVTTSSYGTPIARHFGTMRAAGTIVWATDLKESSEKVGGGKGQPSTTTYSYSSSFAVALSSRPIRQLKRVWADGNLLRGAAGDLKVGGALRVYHGHGDQARDPLLAAAEGAQCPAFRGMAYCVFEDLQLADFGNRIPALNFEIVADDGEVRLVDVLAPVDTRIAGPALTNLAGFSDDGGALAGALQTIDRAYPLACDTGGDALSLSDGDPDDVAPLMLPPAVIDRSEEGHGGFSGQRMRRRADMARIPTGMRYYDTARDYQPSVQLAGGQALGGAARLFDFPGALAASAAKRLVDQAAKRARQAQDRLSYRIAEIDPALRPGAPVRVPGRPGLWRVEAWEWNEAGVELDLVRLPVRKGATNMADAGRALQKPDYPITPTQLAAFELPWDGTGLPGERRVYAAASSLSQGWSGAALYAVDGESLVPIGSTGNRRSVMGTSITTLPPSRALMIDRSATVDVQLISPDFLLDSVTPEELANGANRALLGGEVVQFAQAQSLGGGAWRLGGLLRGRGGTEDQALRETPAGARFVLLDHRPIALDPAAIGSFSQVAAIGLVDDLPIVAPIAPDGLSLRPLTPVHPRAVRQSDGGLLLGWIRRARGAWLWTDGVDVPLVEQAERYEVGIGDPDAPALVWTVDAPSLALDGDTLADLRADHAGAVVWVRQLGTHARSLPLALTILA